MATAPTSTARTKKIAAAQRLTTIAEKAAGKVAAAKQQVRAAKSQLKEARKSFKAEKKLAKQARKKAEVARAALLTRVRKAAPPKAASKAGPQAKAPAEKPATLKKDRANKPRRAAKSKEGTRPPMRSAADVAKSVIERLKSPPPALAPAPPAQPQPSDPAKPG